MELQESRMVCWCGISKTWGSELVRECVGYRDATASTKIIEMTLELRIDIFNFLFKYEFYQWISLTINSAYGHAPQVWIIPASITNHLTSFYLPGKGYWKRNFCMTSSVRQSVGWPSGLLVGLSVFHTKSAGSCSPCFYRSTCQRYIHQYDHAKFDRT